MAPDATARPAAVDGALLDARPSLIDLRPPELATAVVESVREAVFATTLDGTVVSWNAAAAELYGRTGDEMVGREVAVVVPEDLLGELAVLLRRVARGDHVVGFETVHRRSDGILFDVAITMSPILDATGSVLGAATVARDVTERTRQARVVEHRALHDPLTNLPNRAVAVEQLRLALARSVRRGTYVAVLFVDLDRFKDVNDDHGHLFGDAVLRVAAHRIRAAVRAGDIVCRFGGDEFVVVCADLEHPNEAKAVIDRIADAIGVPFDLAEADEVHVGASIGLRVSAGGEDPMTLIRDADEAMYRQKVRGRRRPPGG